MQIYITTPYQHFRKNAGFSMVEVLVTLVIISIGLFGMAGMQALSLNNIGATHLNSDAAMLADSLASSISANKAYWGGSENGLPDGLYPAASVDISGTTLSPSIANYVDCENGVNGVNGVTCDPSQMATFDLSKWGENLATALPGGRGNVICKKNATVTKGQSLYLCVITVSWNEKNIKSLSGGGVNTATPTYTTRTYTMVVQQ